MHIRDSDIDFQTRIVELERTIAGAEGVEVVRGRLGSRPMDLVGFLTAPSRRGVTETTGPQTGPGSLGAQVALDNNRADPLIAVAYPAGTRQVRIEVPIPPDMIGADYDPAQGGVAGLPPVPQTMDMDTVGIVTLESLDDEGGEVTYQVSVDDLDDGTTEDTIEAGAVRGEYRVYALRTPDDNADADFVSAFVLRGQVSAPSVKWDALVAQDTTLGLRKVCITNIRAVGGTLVFRVDDGAWTVGDENVGNWELAADGDGYDATILLPAINERSKQVTFAVRTGTDPDYEYVGETPLPIGSDMTPADMVLHGTTGQVPATSLGGGIEGRLFTTPL